VGSQLARRVAGSQSAVDRLTSAQLSAEVWQHRYNRLATQVQPPDNRYKCLATDTNVWQQTQTSGNIHKRLATDTNVWQQTQTSGNRHTNIWQQTQTSGNTHTNVWQHRHKRPGPAVSRDCTIFTTPVQRRIYVVRIASHALGKFEAMSNSMIKELRD